MLNLLHDISSSIFRIQSLRTRIAALTEDLHAEELKIAAYSQQCIGVHNAELRAEEQARQKV